MESPKNLTVKQASKELQIHPVTLRRAAKRGDIPGVKVGREWRFNQAALDQFMKKPVAA